MIMVEPTDRRQFLIEFATLAFGAVVVGVGAAAGGYNALEPRIELAEAYQKTRSLTGRVKEISKKMLPAARVFVDGSVRTDIPVPVIGIETASGSFSFDYRFFDGTDGYVTSYKGRVQ